MIKKAPIAFLGGAFIILFIFSVQMSHSFSNYLGGNNNTYLPFVVMNSGGSVEISILVDQDAYVKSAQPYNNYGTINVLRVRDDAANIYTSYFKFDVTGVNGAIQKATIRLFVADGNEDGFIVYSVSNNYLNSNNPWSETGLTWANAPAMTGPSSIYTGNVSDNEWVEVDVTSMVSENGTYSFGIVNLTQDSIFFNSKESNNNRPILMVEYTDSPGSGEMWISNDRLASLPTSGVAWNNILNAAQQNTANPNISDLNDDTDVYVLAQALVYARTGQIQYRDDVINSLATAIGTESGAGVLAVGRNLLGYVIAADLIHLQSVDPALDLLFRQWLSSIRTVIFTGGGPPYSIISCHNIRPNNYGTHCGASRIAIGIYLNDQADVQMAADVFKGWLGDRATYAGFNYGDLDWQCNPTAPVGINPAGCTKNGYSIDGVLPDDQRRGGGFSWPPPQENYVWEALQGAIVQAELLSRAGYPAWQWEDQALLRAITWLHQEANYEATGDDSWQPWLFNYTYGSNFPVESPTNPGKAMGWTDWTHD